MGSFARQLHHSHPLKKRSGSRLFTSRRFLLPASRIHDGGQIALDTDTIEKQLVVNITDNGMGMTPDEIKSIFKGFFQGNHCLGGLGLGLAISRKLVELHNGSIRAFSPGKGKGATFSIKFPVVRTPDKFEGPEPTATSI